MFKDGTAYRAVVYTYVIPGGTQDDTINGSFLANVTYDSREDVYHIQGYEYIKEATFFDSTFSLWVGKLSGDRFSGGINRLDSRTTFSLRRIDENDFKYQGPHNHAASRNGRNCMYCGSAMTVTD